MIDDAVEKAIQHWVVESSGLASDRVRWKGQGKGGQPADCYIGLSVIEEREIGPGWTTKEPAPNPVPGADVLFRRVREMRGVLVLECFTGSQSWEDCRPDRKLEKVHGSRSLPNRAQSLRASGIGFGNTAPMQVFNFQRSMQAESRALLRVDIFYIDQSATELGTFIESATIGATIGELSEQVVAAAPRLLAGPATFAVASAGANLTKA